MQRLQRHKPAMRAMVTLVLCAFVYFCCGNTLFIHSHTYAGSTIVHSHPYLPSSHHSHSAADYGAVSWCNAAIAAMKAETALQPMVPTMPIATIATAVAVRQLCAGITHYAGRAPPCV
ncbi:MAG: hypothetical protein ACI30W_05235 [Muribaculaceae bacterium]